MYTCVFVVSMYRSFSFNAWLYSWRVIGVLIDLVLNVFSSRKHRCSQPCFLPRMIRRSNGDLEFAAKAYNVPGPDL